MTNLSALLLGLIEGLTEFLPISSTAHLLLAEKLLGLSQTEFSKSFTIIIQLGAILAIATMYARTVWQNKILWGKIFVAFLPTAIIGFALYKVIKKHFFEDTFLILSSLLIGGVVLIVFERWHNKSRSNLKEITEISYKDAFIIGCCQSIAVIPGVSRAGATIIGGLTRDIKRAAIVEFSFLLAVPTMLSATAYEIFKSGISIDSTTIGPLIIGFVAATVSAYFAVKIFLNYVRHKDFTNFGIYRIVIAIILAFVLL